ncbi:hypothetical protein [Clostridium disporicum]|uniref:Uncharacterized protein n=1 Tax=Clostridium disporicum TaxID=84024 RepID=A0A174F8L6_9CLOT|nr:hypothetical protein [Clostridium disporicum]MDY3362164.1 hypothetical protein [Clostridium celatum]CUO45917.1 Uncharacterised protein [Clostridium disporicum]
MKRRTIMLGVIITMVCLTASISLIIAKGNGGRGLENLEIEYIVNESENMIESISDNDRYNLDSLLSFLDFIQAI